MKVIVVGAGIVGSSAAYHLAREGAEVVVIDKFHEGQATAAGAGIICPWTSRIDNQHWYQMAKEGACYYPALASLLENDGETNFGYKKVGALSVSKDPDKLDQIKQIALERKKETPEVGEVTWLSSKEARALFPPLERGYKAIHVTGAARLDGRYLRDALQRAAKKHGAVFKTGQAQLEVSRGRIQGVSINNEVIAADEVIAATGAWTPEFLEPLGIDISVRPQRGQIVHLSLPGQDTSEWPVVLPVSSHYLLSFDDNRVVVGATREKKSGFDYRITAKGLQEVLEKALDVAPGLSDGTVQDVRVGFRPMGADILPLLGPLPDISGLVMATGLGATGLTMGPYVGKLAAQLSLNEDVEMDLTPYLPSRNRLN